MHIHNSNRYIQHTNQPTSPPKQFHTRIPETTRHNLHTNTVVQQQFIDDVIQRAKLYHKYKHHRRLYGALKYMLPKKCHLNKTHERKYKDYQTELSNLESNIWKQYFGMDISKYAFLTIPDSFNQRTRWLDEHVPSIIRDKHTEHGVQILSTYLM